MELCSLEEAYSPPVQMGAWVPKPGCTDSKPSREERRAARKKAKRCKGPAETYWATQEDPDAPAAATGSAPETDPDRPAVKRMGEVPAFPSLQEAFPDVSGGEGFRMPRMPASNCLISDPGLPSYFGKGLEDTEEGFQDLKGGVAPQTMAGGFEIQGVGKAGSGGTALPAPSVVDVWKPLTPANSSTAFFSDLPAPGGRVVESTAPAGGPSVGPYAKRDPTATPRDLPKQLLPTTMSPTIGVEEEGSVLSKLNELTRRLNELERREARNPQREILLFVVTGLGLLVGMDVVVRAARG